MRREFTLYRDHMSETGVVLEPGSGRTEITKVAQLPGHRVEIHGFWTNDAAVFFAQGLRVAGGNRVAFHRAAESGLGRFVVVAHLTDDRPADATTPEEAVPLIEHRPSGEQARITARFLDGRLEQDRREDGERRARAAPALAALAAAGIDASYDGNTGIVVKANCGGTDSLGWAAAANVAPAGEGLWTVGGDLHGQNGVFAEGEMDARVLALMAEAGLAFDAKSCEFSFPPVPTIDVAERVARMGRVWDRLGAIALDLRRERIAAETDEKKRRQRDRRKAPARERRAMASRA